MVSPSLIDGVPVGESSQANNINRVVTSMATAPFNWNPPVPSVRDLRQRSSSSSYSIINAAVAVFVPARMKPYQTVTFQVREHEFRLGRFPGSVPC
ncbi:hypothetical protein BBJK_00016 [Bifidobacterium bifidum LMG 13195]|uniref:Uncharacterized protein n=1 Tax=Bifidobacterium bifidum LMG 13195 TaxID=1207542 RepID=A0A286T9G6_BIFBI|nr:hypothetical protein BBJK_00016 [Bifidobacterium bifidum LMG 13195]